MKELCKSCNIDGLEIEVKPSTGGGLKYTLEECKKKCHSTCIGIDYGKNDRAGECWINFKRLGYTYNKDFDAWDRSSDCGTLIYKLHYCFSRKCK